MKKNQNKNRRLIVLVSVTLAVLGVTGFLFWQHQSRVTKNTPSSDKSPGANGINYSPPTQTEKKEVEENKTKDLAESNNQPKPVTGVSISSLEQVADKTIIVKTSLTGVATWSSCRLTISNEGNSFSRTANTIYQPEFSTCMGFALPASDFPQTGTWTFKLIGIQSTGAEIESSSKNLQVTK